MARKGKNKRKAKNYSKKKFANIFCSVCRLCDSKSKPNFCYPTIYKSNPDLFVSAVYPNLIDAGEWIASRGMKPSGIAMSRFSEIFCQTGVCTAGTPMSASACPSHDVCYPAFLKQVEFEAPTKTKIKKRNRKQNKSRKVYVPYPTFFMREDNPDFKEFVRKTLHGDDDKQQDKDKEPDGDTKGNTDRSPKDR